MKHSEVAIKQSEVAKEEAVELYKVALEQSMKQSEVVIKQSEMVIKQNEVVIKQNEVAIEAKDELIRILQQQLLMSRGLLTARGIFEQELVKCLVEMKRLKLCPSTMKYNASAVILKILELKASLPKVVFQCSWHGLAEKLRL